MKHSDHSWIAFIYTKTFPFTLETFKIVAIRESFRDFSFRCFEMYPSKTYQIRAMTWLTCSMYFSKNTEKTELCENDLM